MGSLAGGSIRIVADNVDDSRFPTWHIATIEADADGRYSQRVGVSESALYRVGVVSGDTYAASAAATETFNAYWHTEIVGADATPEPVGQGSTVTMRSQVVRPDTSGSRGVIAGVPVVLQFSSDGTNWRQVRTGTTDTEGRSALSVVADRDGYWRTVYAGGASGNASAYTPDMSATSGTDYVDVKYATRMGTFNASPEPVVKGKPITVKGRLDRLIGTWQPAAANAAITIYFKPTGATTWTSMAALKTTSTGTFSKQFTASKDGYWMAKYNGSSTYLGIEGPADYVDVT
jgi:hypothetical protein